MSIGKKVVELRKKIGITQVELADYLGVDQSFISQVESGSRVLNIEMATKFTHLAGLEPDYFFDESSFLDCPTIQIDFRSANMTKLDFDAIADINIIASNLRWMNKVASLHKKHEKDKY